MDVDKVKAVIFQGLLRLGRDVQVAVALLVTQIHLYLCVALQINKSRHDVSDETFILDHLRFPYIVHQNITTNQRQPTCSPAREGEHDDVIVGPRVVRVRREEGQFRHAFLP